MQNENRRPSTTLIKVKPTLLMERVNGDDVMVAVESLEQVPSGSYASEIGQLKQLMENDLLTKANDLYKANKFKEASSAFLNLYNVAPDDQSLFILRCCMCN